MKVTSRFIVRAALVVTAGGVIGAFGACKDSSSPNPPPAPPPPPPPVLVAPAAPTLTAVDTTKISLAWTYSDTTITGFRLDRCSGAGCTNFAQVGTNLAKNLRAYTDTGLAVRTSYSYRIRALRGTDTSAWSPSATLTTGSTGGGSASFIMVGAGEISTGNSDAAPTATAKLVNDILTANPTAIAFTIGNNYTDPNASSFAGTRFDGTWGMASTGVGGTFKDRTYYALGNNDFSTSRGPSAVYGYFGANVGPADKGWYSFDKGSWHIVVLNTSDWQHGADSTFGITSTLVRVPSAQVDWLTNDLANTTQKCIAVISWERRFFTTSGGVLGYNSNMKPMGQIMYDNGVDLLISAKDKLYARFTQLNSETHTPDPKGFREFIVGTGGRTNDGKPAGTPAEREAYIGRDVATGTPDQWGVLKLTLGDGNYSWEFVNTNPAGPTDKSDAPVSCH